MFAVLVVVTQVPLMVTFYAPARYITAELWRSMGQQVLWYIAWAAVPTPLMMLAQQNDEDEHPVATDEVTRS